MFGSRIYRRTGKGEKGCIHDVAAVKDLLRVGTLQKKGPIFLPVKDKTK